MNETKTDLSELIRQIQAGDEESFRKFFDLYRDMIYRYIYRFVGNQVDAEDLAIDTFVRFHNNINKVDPSGNPRSYLFSIAHNIMVDFFRQYKPSLSLDESIATGLEEDRDDSVELVKDLLTHLPPRHRDLVVLKYLEKYTLEEIAELKGKSLDSIKSSLKRARKHLIKVFNKYYNK